jgi:hypothetical protein
MPPINDFSRLRVQPAPQTERLRQNQRLTGGFPAYQNLCLKLVHHDYLVFFAPQSAQRTQRKK